MQFKELNIIPSILKALSNENYTAPTPIQEEAIPVILSGRDLLGCAQTGTGKTAAFAIPTLQLLSKEITRPTTQRNIRALIITPTRELALQIYESFCTYGKFTNLKSTVAFGGVSQKPQEEMLQRGVDILVATPGRLIDLMNQRLVDLRHLEIFILDEADRMLDMGFINDVKKIIAKTPVKKQTLLFSATMPSTIAELSRTLLNNPSKISITPESTTVDMIKQYVYFVDKENKKSLLLHILKDKSITSVLVFTRTKHGSDKLVRILQKAKVSAQAIHGDKSQGARQLALKNFKNKTLRVLVATDIAARGIDIEELSHVVNFDLPNVPETYVHRIGRTGRAGLGGTAISFCDFDEKELLADIQKLIRKSIAVVNDHPYPMLNNTPTIKATQPRNKSSQKESSKESSQKEISKKGTSRKKTSTEASSSQKKMRMTMSGDLKKKRSNHKLSGPGKKEAGFSKKKKTFERRGQ
jgi:ATP-dependent RNA helicase RhlE